MESGTLRDQRVARTWTLRGTVGHWEKDTLGEGHFVMDTGRSRGTLGHG